MPAAVTTTRPASHKELIERTRSEDSSNFLRDTLPTEIFTILILYLSLFFRSHSIPEITFLILPSPFLLSIFIMWILQSGAMPSYNLLLAVPLPQIIPATCVPCPLSS